MIQTRRIGFISVLLIATATGARAGEVDDFVRAEMQKRQIPGLALLVVREGKVEKMQGYGLANVELKVPVTAETVFPLASVSKQFIAAGVLILAQDGKLELDEKLSRYLKGTPASWAGITIRQLLTHTSGMVRDDPLGMGATPDEREILRAVADLKLDAAPGERWAYSNVGYNLLSLVIQEVSGEPWEKFLERRIFTPLDMSATRRYNLAAIVPDRAAGYVRAPGGLRNAPPLARDLAAGGLLTTLTDLAKWDAALDTDSPLTRASRDQMWARGKLSDGTPAQVQGGAGGYGFGWSIRTSVEGHTLVAHSGSRPGYTTFLARYLDDNLTVAVLLNVGGVEAGSLAVGVAGLYVPGLRSVRP